MSTDLSIKKDLKPNSNLNFLVTLTFGEEDDLVYSPVLSLRAPRAIRSMGSLRTSDFYFNDGGTSVVLDSPTNSLLYSFSKYTKTKAKGFPELILQLKGENNPDDIVVNETRVVVNTVNGSPLKILDDGGVTSYLVSGKSRLQSGDADSRNLIFIKIPENIYNAISPASQGSLLQIGEHTIRVSSTTKKRRRLTVTIGESLSNGLINENNVRDILVVSFKQWDKSLNDKVKRYYFKHGELSESLSPRVEVESNAPSYSFATQYFTERNQQRLVFTRNFSTVGGKKFAFFCTPVRYIKNKEGLWEPMPHSDGRSGWLQRNKNKKIMWGRAEYV
jgi:hypothetical protein